MPAFSAFRRARYDDKQQYDALPGAPVAKQRSLCCPSSSFVCAFSKRVIFLTCLFLLLFEAVYLGKQYALSSLAGPGNISGASSTARAGPSNHGSASLHSGWFSFDDRFDAPFLARLDRAAPVTQPELLFTEACRDLWISRNELCPELKREWISGDSLLSKAHTFDVVYTWQDGSDPKQAAAREHALDETEQINHSGNAVRHFRIHDELRHSMRSLFKSFAAYKQALENIFILSTDLPTEHPHQRIGMVPRWLDVLHPFHSFTKVHAVFPWAAHKTSAYGEPREAEEWRDRALPVYNSMAVESQFTNIPTANDVWWMMCDDFFVLNDMTPSDVYTPLFGLNLRLRYSNFPQIAQKPSDYTGDRDNELQSLRYANWLIGQRFGERPKYLYIEHINKVYSKPLLRELESMFAEELRDAGMVKFRGRGTDLNMHSLFIYFVIERHREALLWSGIVLRADANHDGFLSPDELEQFLGMVGASSKHKSIEVAQPKRRVPVDELLEEAGLPQPKQSEFQAVSANGYSLVRAKGRELGRSKWVDYASPGPSRFCTLEVQRCFKISGSSDTPVLQDSTDLFKHIAFSQPTCGNCLMVALLGASGSKGLEAFLPPKEDLAFGGSQMSSPISDTPILPLSKSWRDADFTVQTNVPRDMTLRSFATRLLLRYSYVMGHESHQLMMIKDEPSARVKLGAAETPTWRNLWNRLSNNPSFLAVNDDIERDEEIVDNMLLDWFRLHWPNPLQWELDR